MGSDGNLVRDPVCGMMIDPATAPAKRVHAGTTYYFCAQGCAKAFEANPAKYTAGAAPRT